MYEEIRPGVKVMTDGDHGQPDVSWHATMCSILFSQNPYKSIGHILEAE